MTERTRRLGDLRVASCTELRRELAEIHRTAMIGEVGAARERMATTDVTAEELIREGRELRERREEAARVYQAKRATKARAASTPAASSNPASTTN